MATLGLIVFYRRKKRLQKNIVVIEGEGSSKIVIPAIRDPGMIVASENFSDVRSASGETNCLFRSEDRDATW